MNAGTPSEIVIQGAKTNNLKNVSLKIPHNHFIVVTGISGSGKSSLVFEIIAQEGQRRYFETLPSFARQFMGKLNRPDVDEIEGLSPVIAIGQRTTGMHARSTVGTLSDLYDLLRLLFARTGKTEADISLSRALFSFNSEVGKCSQCNGIGKKEEIDLNRLVVHPEKTLREGALAPTLPNGYIMYSQVTIDVLNQVCEAEGFNVDIPWNQLTAKQQKVILYGSEKIKVPFGKHSLESRLKWTGIKAKPREEGFYKGMIPIMSDILRRDRNANILKYVHSVTCPECQGARLNSDALSVTIQGQSIAKIVQRELHQLKNWITSHNWEPIAHEIIQKILTQVDLLTDLGLGHLSLDRPANTLRASEIQRIRVANQLLVPLSDVLYVFDEPSIGLHHEENKRLIYHLKQLVQKGNTVIVVEHDLDTISSADHIIEIGPKAGIRGGEVIFNGAYSEFRKQKELRTTSPTLQALENQYVAHQSVSAPVVNNTAITLLGCSERNLKNIDVTFQLGKLNVVSGRSGVGKSSLVKDTLLRTVRQHLGLEQGTPTKIKGHRNLDAINKLIFVDHSPIGKTPRSNPTTYLGLSDHIRDLFASLPEAKERKYTKSRFSFNSKGGRCETCQGAGKTQIGMHFLGNVDLICGTCNGDRFNAETLEIKFKGLSIADIYRLSVDEALTFFEDQKKLQTGLKVLQEIGLGYLQLGQSSTTLSGGEAQRIKIANQLQKKDTGDTLYVVIEPSIGLHASDVQSLLNLFDRIKKQGNTIVCLEQNETIIGWSDWHIELGPQSGSAGGEIIHQGIPKPTSHSQSPISHDTTDVKSNEIVLNGVRTHGLKNIDIRIPKNQLTVVTGLSGSGKSSLVYDTLFAESNARFTESLSTYHRSFLQQNSEAVIDSFSGLGPAIGIHRKGGAASPRSTVGTLSGIYDAFRLLYSRMAQQAGEIYTAQHYSFNHHLGACPACEGFGEIQKCDPDEIIVSPDKSIWDGAISTNKAIAYYADPNGQFMATLREVALQKNWNIERSWNHLEPEIQETILYGTGDTEWDVTWKYVTKTSSGTQQLKAKWLGLCRYIDDEFQRRRHNKNIQPLLDLQHHVTCEICNGSRLKPELLHTKFLGKNIHELTQLSITACLDLLTNEGAQMDTTTHAISKVVLPPVIQSLQTIQDLGLGYLNLDRSVNTLSGGERQRITLAGQLATHLFGVTYVLDEPTIGLDAGQVSVLSNILKQIVANGNTVVVVEHDPSFIQTADYLIEMGPGAGVLGGEVIYQGQLDGLEHAPHSVTYQMMQKTQLSPTKTTTPRGKLFGLQGASAHNLKSIDVEFHGQQIIAITGVSGSGKSSLIKDVLHQSWVKHKAVHCNATYGFEQFDEVILIDQETVALNRLSTPLSYTGILDGLKTLFAKTETAKTLGFKKADFSYQSKKGKCPTCNGNGKIKTSMDFMSDLWLTCDACHGQRYHPSILECKFQGHSIGDLLQMTIQEAATFFEEKSIVAQLKILLRVGLGHLHLGQAGNTLSTGEAQRLKLAKSMCSKQSKKGKTLYLFDEPSTGLHYFDLLPLIEVFQKLVHDGHTVLFIEHHCTLIESAHHIIKLGPGSGDLGGELV
ncbi:ATP-binding cassette domain-containing protein [bacterium SCSIO 12643]|nr:ATP-binding cassette domain-containing protein [bacterium SCSIO 12643]